MENNYILNESNDAAPINNKFTQDNITRCPKCNLICSLELYYKEGIPVIFYQCENEHKGNILLKEYLNSYNKFSLSNEKCNECGKIQKEIKDKFYYCVKCSKFLCGICEKKHSNNEHDIINYKKYDTLCKIHSNTFCCFCIKCNKNLCPYCQLEHKNHDLKNLSEFNYSEESKKELEENIKTIEINIEKLKELKKKIINIFDEFKDSNELEIQFIKLLQYTYQNQLNQHNFNFNIIKNLKNIEENFKLYKINILEKTLEMGNNYISNLNQYLQEYDLKFNSFKNNIQINEKNDSLNSFNNNFKTLNYHTDHVFYLLQLKDGRLASCSQDNRLNIYKKDNFELQLSIKESFGWVPSFTQLNDERIIICSYDKTIKIIKLLDENKYHVDQILKGHNYTIYKVIEINNNLIISISGDKTMKIWKLNSENKFECFKTIFFQNGTYSNILQLNQYEFVTTSQDDGCLKFWNLDNYSCITIINDIITDWIGQNLCLLNENLLCVGGTNSKGFYLIKIIERQIIKNIIGPRTIWNIYKCYDGLLLCSIIDEEGNNTLIKYKYEDENLITIVEKKNAHESKIYCCIELNNKIIASSGHYNLIKLWKE